VKRLDISDKLNDKNICATIDGEIFKPQFLKSLIRAIKEIAEDGFGEVVVVIEHGKPRRVRKVTSQEVNE